jgi:hypothetical protein
MLAGLSMVPFPIHLKGTVYLRTVSEEIEDLYRHKESTQDQGRGYTYGLSTDHLIIFCSNRNICSRHCTETLSNRRVLGKRKLYRRITWNNDLLCVV